VRRKGRYLSTKKKEIRDKPTDDDDRGSESGDDRNAILDFYAPETPSEEDPEEVVPHVSGDE
jgi:hypothetical protein